MQPSPWQPLSPASSPAWSPASVAAAAEPSAHAARTTASPPPKSPCPANERFRIEVINQDATPAEFESSDLRAEKIVVPGGKITVIAGPLKPGTYKFFDDYHPDTAKGTLTAVERQARSRPRCSRA